MEKKYLRSQCESIPSNKKSYPNFTANYAKYAGKIYNYFYYRVNFNEMIAQDLTSAVFIRVLKYYNSYDNSRSFQSWLFAIARNQFINYCKSSGKEIELNDNQMADDDQESKLDIKIKVDHVFKKISRMKTYHQEALKLAFIDGLDNSQIAQVLKKDDRAVRSQICRALTELRFDLNSENI